MSLPTVRRLLVPAALAAFVGLAACSGPSMGDDTPTICNGDEDCPVGLVCEGGSCRAPQDASVPDATAVPDLVVMPTELDFGSPAVGEETPLMLTLRNVGSGALHISRIELVEVDMLAEYDAAPSGDVDLELQPDTATTIRVTLRPADGEEDLGQIVIHSDDPDAPIVTIALISEVKGAPVLEVLPDAIDFGVVGWADSSRVTLDILNTGTGNAPLELLDVAISTDSGFTDIFTAELFTVDPITNAETLATPPVLLAPGGAVARIRVTLTTLTLRSGPIPIESLVLTTDAAAPEHAERRLAMTGTVLGCAFPAPETCDGTDENCDLEIDDGAPGGFLVCATGLLGACAAGTTACSDGAIECLPNLVPVVELCDGVDSNCDGVIDDGLVRTCTTICGSGVEFCVLGSWEGCTAGDATPDVCNGIDDDCDPTTEDGSADPGLGLACDGSGDTDLCEDGVRECTAGVLVCTDVGASVLDVCDDVDNDCNIASLDGSGDAMTGTACDGTGDSDLCSDGTIVCVDGTFTCDDRGPDALDLCNGADDDCDAASDDGTEDPALGAACDSAGDTDLCADGARSCSAGVLGCDDVGPSLLDLCGGGDDDCDGLSADGTEDSAIGVACDGGDDFDLCADGAMACSAGTLACADPGPDLLELCDGVDNDCNAATGDGTDDPTVGSLCDGSGDTDLCQDGAFACALGVLSCSDGGPSLLDLCGGGNQDCDATSADGSEDPLRLTPCDGTGDSDLCLDGTTICSGGALSCNDAGPGLLDLCNGLNDDCDSASVDGAEDPGRGVACDGDSDSDLCLDGVFACTTGALACSDAGPDLLDLCGGGNQDCDATSADGTEDPAVGMACDGTDSDLCTDGVQVCTGGALSCNDSSTSSVDICNGDDDDCNPSSSDGSGEAWFAQPCDGPDADFGREGQLTCTAATLACTDTTGGTMPSLAGITDVDAGLATVCARASNGRVYCWGDIGGLGTPYFTVDAPVVVPSITTATSVAAGNGFACARLATGAATCWGDDLTGQLGDGAPGGLNRTPVTVTGLSDVAELGAGDDFACARRTGGGVTCWGNNAEGQIGSGAPGGSMNSPTTVAGLPAAAISIGVTFATACAVLANAEIYCWGRDFGPTPVLVADVPTSPAPVQVSPEGVCVVRTNGTVYCVDGYVPGTVPGITTAVEVVTTGAGFAQAACARLADGTVTCWGYNYAGLLGDGTRFSRETAEVVAGLTQTTAIGIGPDVVCTTSGAAGNVSCWGRHWSYDGLLGSSSGEGYRATPTIAALGITDATAVRVQSDHACAVRASGRVSCWGLGTSGQLGNGLSTTSTSPVEVSSLTDATHVKMGRQSACARRATGAVMCWGSGATGALGTGLLSQSTPQFVTLVADALTVVGGNDHTCALRAGGAVSCWGSDARGQLGNGGAGDYATATAIPGFAGTTDLCAGDSYTCALMAGGEIACAGQPPLLTTSTSPALAATVVTATAIDCTETEVRALRADGVVVRIASVGVVAPVRNLTGIARLAGTCAVSTGGTLLCGGANDFGTLGDGSRFTRTDSFAVPGLTGATAAHGQGTTTCVVTAGTVRCWGENSYGVLGIGIDNDLPAYPGESQYLPALVHASYP